MQEATFNFKEGVKDKKEAMERKDTLL